MGMFQKCLGSRSRKIFIIYIQENIELNSLKQLYMDMRTFTCMYVYFINLSVFIFDSFHLACSLSIIWLYMNSFTKISK